MPIMCGGSKIKLLPSGQVKKIYCENSVVYSSGSTVTYHITDSLSYTEEVDEGESVLSPKSFSPDGLVGASWDFIGWREDKTAGAAVLTNRVMGETPVDLYAVYRLAITLSYNGNGNTGGATEAETKYRYYNNGNYADPSFTLKANGFTRTGYVFGVWAAGSASGAQYKAGASVTLTAGAAYYAVWVQAVASFGYTGGMQTYTVPVTGLYLLTLKGAQGSAAASNYGNGGAGGVTKKYVVLAAGTVLYFVVGRQVQTLPEDIMEVVMVRVQAEEEGQRMSPL